MNSQSHIVDTRATYLGLSLPTPVVASSSPLCEKVENLQRMEEAGAGAIVLQSLFEEQFALESEALHESLLEGTDSYGEALSYFPELGEYKMGPERYLAHVEAARKALHIPVIASLNGVTPAGWTRFAKSIQDAGAHALELNVYYIPGDPNITSFEVEERYTDLVAMVSEAVKIPVAVKVGPYFSAPAHMFRRLGKAGARAIVLFNRFYQPDFDLETLDVVPSLNLSRPDELRLRLRWASILHGRIEPELAITGGVHGGEDVIKCLMSGANVAMVTSALLQKGIPHLRTIVDEMVHWMITHEYDSVRQMVGSLSQSASGNPGAFERANYLKVLSTYMLR